MFVSFSRRPSRRCLAVSAQSPHRLLAPLTAPDSVMAHEEADVDWGEEDAPERLAVVESTSRTSVELTPQVEVEAHSAAPQSLEA